MAKLTTAVDVIMQWLYEPIHGGINFFSHGKLPKLSFIQNSSCLTLFCTIQSEVGTQN